ncbi:MAG: gamma-glutamyltransferase [Sandaracinus sp.]|nr:gamma-glutamyltransferase [Sandaracinus sp.]
MIFARHVVAPGVSRITDQVDDAEPRAAASRRGTVVTSHPRAVEAGIAALEAGGSAVDAAVAAACVLGVVDPMSTSLGGDCFALVWNAEERTLHGFNGSGRAPALADAASLRAEGHDAVPTRGWKSITVPGALDAYAQLLERFGRMSLADALAPAVAAAEGFEVTPSWPAIGRPPPRCSKARACRAFSPPPGAGERFAHPQLAQTLRAIAEGGVDVFYRGAFAQKLDEASRAAGGWLRADDLARHAGEWVVPLEGWYRGHPVYELPPNGQGIVVLEALALLEEHPLGDLDEVERTHLQIEALKLAFADAFEHVGDPDRSDVLRLLDPVYLEERAAKLDGFVDRANDAPDRRAFAGWRHGLRRRRRRRRQRVLAHRVDLRAFRQRRRGGRNRAAEPRCALRARRGASERARSGRRPYHTILPAMVFRHDLPWLVFGVVRGLPAAASPGAAPRAHDRSRRVDRRRREGAALPLARRHQDSVRRRDGSRARRGAPRTWARGRRGRRARRLRWGAGDRARARGPGGRERSTQGRRRRDHAPARRSVSRPRTPFR